MQRFNDKVTLINGDIVRNASVRILTYPGGALATLYSDNGVTPTANPLTTDNFGKFYFYAADGRYSTQTSGTGIDGTITELDSILLEDPANGINITGTGARITGDFSNATIANRVMFQTSTVNSGTGIGILPSGSGVNPSLELYNSSDANNAGSLIVSPNATEARVIASKTGTGTFLPMTFYTGGSERMRIDTSGNVLVKTPAGLGYGTGAGGTVTQATSKTTAVTLNTPSGRITTFNDALGAGSLVSFSVNCSAYAITDTVSLMISGGIANGQSYRIWPVAAGAGVFSITIENRSAGSLSEAIQIQFNVHKGATA